MFNLIKMDLHRLTHSVSFYVMIIICFAIAFMNGLVAKYIPESSSPISFSMEIDVVETEQPKSFDEEVDAAVNNAAMGLAADIEDNSPQAIERVISEKNDIESLIELLFVDGNLMILISVFVAMFVCSEQKNGFIKNIAGQQKFRGLIVISKIVTAAVQVAVLFASSIVFTIIVQLLLADDSFKYTVSGEFFAIVAIQYLVHFALAVLIIFICTFTRNSALSQVLGVLVSSGFFAIVYALLNYFIRKIDAFSEFNLINYVIEGCSMSVMSGIDNNIIIRVIAVSLVYALSAGIGSVLLMQKRDVK